MENIFFLKMVMRSTHICAWFQKCKFSHWQSLPQGQNGSPKTYFNCIQLSVKNSLNLNNPANMANVLIFRWNQTSSLKRYTSFSCYLCSHTLIRNLKIVLNIVNILHFSSWSETGKCGRLWPAFRDPEPPTSGLEPEPKMNYKLYIL